MREHLQLLGPERVIVADTRVQPEAHPESGLHLGVQEKFHGEDPSRSTLASNAGQKTFDIGLHGMGRRTA